MDIDFNSLLFKRTNPSSMLNNTSSAWYSTLPKDLDSFSINSDSSDDGMPTDIVSKSIDLNTKTKFSISSTDSSDSSYKSDLNSDSSSDSDSSSSSLDVGFTTKTKPIKDQTANLQTLNPEPIGQTLQGELEYLASAHHISSKRLDNVEDETLLRISQATYKYFDDEKPDRKPIQKQIEESSSSDDDEFEKLRRKYLKKPIAYVPPISTEAYDRLNKTQNGLPGDYMSARKTVKLKEKLWKEQTDRSKETLKKKFKEIQNLPKVEYIRRSPPREDRPEFIEYKFKKLKNNAPSFYDRPKQEKRKPSPTPNVQDHTQQEDLQTQQYSEKPFRNYTIEKRLRLEEEAARNNIPEHFEKTKIKNKAPKGMKKKYPELYSDKKKKDKKEDSELLEVFDPGRIQIQKTEENNPEETEVKRTLTKDEAEKALEEYLDIGGVQEITSIVPKRKASPRREMEIPFMMSPKKIAEKKHQEEKVKRREEKAKQRAEEKAKAKAKAKEEETKKAKEEKKDSVSDKGAKVKKDSEESVSFSTDSDFSDPEEDKKKNEKKKEEEKENEEKKGSDSDSDSFESLGSGSDFSSDGEKKEKESKTKMKEKKDKEKKSDGFEGSEFDSISSIDKSELGLDDTVESSSDATAVTDSSEESSFVYQAKSQRPHIDPHETEATRLRNAAIRQKLALRAAREKALKEEEFERDVNLKVVAARIAPTLRKLEKAAEIPPKDMTEVIKRNKEEERNRLDNIDRRIKTVQRVEFIAKRQERRMRAKCAQNAQMKETRRQQQEVPPWQAKRKEKNEELRKLWDPNPAHLFDGN